MRKIPAHFSLIVALLVATSCEKNKLPSAAEAVLRGAESFEFYSLNPEVNIDPKPDDFHRWHVIGHATVADKSVQKSLLDALDSGTSDSGLSAYRCFNPRHAIRATKGKDHVDLIVCFECSQIHTFLNGNKLDTILVSKSPEPVFDQVLRDLGLTLAPKSQ